jgi:DNA ligase-1
VSNADAKQRTELTRPPTTDTESPVKLVSKTKKKRVVESDDEDAVSAGPSSQAGDKGEVKPVNGDGSKAASSSPPAKKPKLASIFAKPMQEKKPVVTREKEPAVSREAKPAVSKETKETEPALASIFAKPAAASSSKSSNGAAKKDDEDYHDDEAMDSPAKPEDVEGEGEDELDDEAEEEQEEEAASKLYAPAHH